MRAFLIRARKAPVQAARFLRAVGREPYVEHLAQIFLNALFVAQGHRDNTVLYLCLEGSSDFPRLLTLDGASLGSLSGLHEKALLTCLADMLLAGEGLGKSQHRQVERGMTIAAVSFEAHIKALASEGRQIYLLDRRGENIGQVALSSDALFVMTDHIPMPKKSFHSLDRLGARRLSLGPVMLHASQCITVIHNHLDGLKAPGD
ncbi:MAG: tRNA (pseudouridine(54)-N(1))-methyltransferase TrmY [Gammaproteobacteria bacterium]|nr:tRNA (pseudouridine(54)-N(1))-methyltransferase TrmY [Gammaproteobacteria bacterium]